jgi:hypothetical protein
MERMLAVVFENETKAYEGSRASINSIKKGAFRSMLNPWSKRTRTAQLALSK